VLLVLSVDHVPVHAREPFLFPLSAHVWLAVEQLRPLVRTYRHGRMDGRMDARVIRAERRFNGAAVRA
jgi:hypothetical protein